MTEFSPKETAFKIGDLFARSGISASRLSLIRRGDNLTYLDEKNAIVIKVYGPKYKKEQVKRIATLANFLRAEDFPAIRLDARVKGQPVSLEDIHFTFWEYIPRESRSRDYGQFGASLKALHALFQTAPVEPPVLDVAALLESRYAQLRDSEVFRDKGEEGAFARMFFTISQALAEHRYESRPQLVHGDAHIGNTINSGEQLFWSDFDRIHFGYVEWDLVPILLSKRRFGLSGEEVARFRGATGYSDALFDSAAGLVPALEFMRLCWLAGNRDLSPRYENELQHRLSTLSSPGRDVLKWNVV